MTHTQENVADMTLARRNEVAAKTVERYYNGRRGCMCGCLGTYYDNDGSNDRKIKTAVNRLLNDPDAALQDGYILYMDTRTRTSAVYFTV